MVIDQICMYLFHVTERGFTRLEVHPIQPDMRIVGFREFHYAMLMKFGVHAMGEGFIWQCLFYFLQIDEVWRSTCRWEIGSGATRAGPFGNKLECCLLEVAE